MVHVKIDMVFTAAQVGSDLTSVYWQPGNGSMFLDLVQQLTGKGQGVYQQESLFAAQAGYD